MSGCSLIGPDASPILLLAIQKGEKNASKGSEWAATICFLRCNFAKNSLARLHDK